MFPDHLDRRQVCPQADQPQARLHRGPKEPARQRRPVDPQDGQVRTSRFVRTVRRVLQLKSRAAVLCERELKFDMVANFSVA